MQDPKAKSVRDLIETVARLRAPDGCPWDRAQDHQSLRPFLIEEAYEVLTVLDKIHSPQDLKNTAIRSEFREELGDLLMQVVLHTELTREQGAFDFYEVAQELNDKLIRRHPHVFKVGEGQSKAANADEALQSWEKQKSKEKDQNVALSVLDGLPQGLPSLQRTARLIEKVTKVGFQWPDFKGPLAKAKEEFQELEREIEAFGANPSNENLRKLEGEIGDLLFSVANLAYLLKVSPEDALRTTLARFEKRFRYVERRVKTSGRTLTESNLAEMDLFWDEAKVLEKTRVIGITGGIGAGKSTLAAIFAEQGYAVLDADVLAAEQFGLAAAEIAAVFGSEDRAAVRAKTFADPASRTKLEQILHPRIAQTLIAAVKGHLLDGSLPRDSRGRPVIFYEAALLVETGRYQDFSGLITVEAPEEIRVDRLVRERKIDREQALAIMAAQADRESRIRVANWVVINEGTPSELKAQALTIIASL